MYHLVARVSPRESRWGDGPGYVARHRCARRQLKRAGRLFDERLVGAVERNAVRHVLCRHIDISIFNHGDNVNAACVISNRFGEEDGRRLKTLDAEILAPSTAVYAGLALILDAVG